MPIYDYECIPCGHVFEVIEAVDNKGARACPSCGRDCAAHRIISVSAVYLGNQDAPWLKTVGEVLGDSPAENRFKKDPTRANYHHFLKEKGLRPLEKGEKSGHQSSKTNESQTRRKLIEAQRKRHAISI